MRTVEGKDHMPFSSYENLANILVTSTNPKHIAVRPFLHLDWNFILRADHIVNANIAPIGMFHISL